MIGVMIKKICLMCGVLGLVVFSGVAGAAEVPAVVNDTYVYDGAGVIDDAAEVDLNAKLRSLEQDTSAEIFVVTVGGLDGAAIEDFSYKVANEMGIGQEEHDNGLLLLVSPPEGTRNVRIEVGKGMEGIFNDAKVGRILDADFVPYRENGDYQGGIVKTVDSLIAETRDNAEWVGKAAADEDIWVVFVAFLFIIAVFIFVIVASLRSAYKMGRKEIVRKGLTENQKMWAVIGIGMAVMSRNNEEFRRKHGNGGGGWFGGSGGGGGWSGGGSGGGSFGGGGATR